jgi:hypothetical protein
VLDWFLDAFGVQVYPTSGVDYRWLAQSCKCPARGAEWSAIAPLGSVGIECPFCLALNLLYTWKEEKTGA